MEGFGERPKGCLGVPEVVCEFKLGLEAQEANWERGLESTD